MHIWVSDKFAYSDLLTIFVFTLHISITKNDTGLSVSKGWLSFCSELWIRSDFFVHFSKLPAFFKLCQDGVWGVRKVSHVYWQRLIVFAHLGILKLNYTILTDTVFILLILQRLVQNVTWVYQLQAQKWCGRMNCHNSSLVCCVTSQDGFVLILVSQTSVLNKCCCIQRHVACNCCHNMNNIRTLRSVQIMSVVCWKG